MDELVLQAQKWVNSTYTEVSGYQRVEENGRTGFPTMYALTRALQHELGIATLSDSFGPTTLSKLTARGPIGPGESNTNIVKIIQCGFYCKGYAAGGITGSYGSSVSYAIDAMMGNMGVGPASTGTVVPKFFKALLTMDAYVVLSSGTEEIRTIQQWLNGRYWTRSAFFLSPCDGIYTRDVQQALMKALQYEFGIADASVNGNFGPSTQAGLRGHKLSQGSTGIFVQLYSAACVFNGAVIIPRGTNSPDFDSYSTVFKETFDEKLTVFTRAFQKFSEIGINGTADYTTWAQLLVSQGDEDRQVSACDTRFHIVGGRSKALYDTGYRLVGRYLDEDANSTLDKELQSGELQQIFDGGLRVFPISQYNARVLADFTYAQGADHGRRAHARAVSYGFGRGTVIYFAVDYDATGEQISSNVIPYFQGVQSALAGLGRRYLAGVYGSRNVCAQVTNTAYARFSFVSGMSYGFSGNLGFPLPSNWSFNQIKEFVFTANGDSFDLDRVAYRPGTDRGVGPETVGVTASPVAAFLDYVDEVQACAVRYGGADPSLRTMEFLRHPNYTETYDGWAVLIGPADEDWLNYAAANGPTRQLTFLDPSYGVDVNIDHIAATANSVYLKGSGEGTAANRGDFGGWGGDLSTFFGDWRNNDSSYASGYAFCTDRLASPTVVSTFPFGDFLEDVEGYHLGTAVRGGASFATELRRRLTGSAHRSRFSDFYQGRYGGDRDRCIATAKNMLDNVSPDDTLATIRTAAIRRVSGYDTVLPGYMPDYKLRPFLEGYADKLVQLAEQG